MSYSNKDRKHAKFSYRSFLTLTLPYSPQQILRGRGGHWAVGKYKAAGYDNESSRPVLYLVFSGVGVDQSQRSVTENFCFLTHLDSVEIEWARQEEGSGGWAK